MPNAVLLHYQSQTISLDNIKAEIAADNVECSGYGLSEVIILGTVTKTQKTEGKGAWFDRPSSLSVWKESSEPKPNRNRSAGTSTKRKFQK